MKFDFGSFSIGTIAGGIIIGYFNHWLAKRRRNKDRDIRQFSEAANKFRSNVIQSLEGVYPDLHVYLSSNEVNDIIRGSITKIVTAGTEFKEFLPSLSRSSFERTIEDYSETARKIDWESQRAHEFYPDMKKPGKKSPKELFKQRVDALLSYAREK